MSICLAYEYDSYGLIMFDVSSSHWLIEQSVREIWFASQYDYFFCSGTSKVQAILIGGLQLGTS